MTARGKLLALTVASLLNFGCSNYGEQSDERGRPSPAADSLEWLASDDSGQSVMSDDLGIRCWPIGPQYDCLLAKVWDQTETSADARVHWSYFRFLPKRLPTSRSELDLLSLSDGYSCLTTKSGNTMTIIEQIWNDGRAVDRNWNQVRAYEGTSWTPQRVSETFAKAGIEPVRPYFECLLLDDLVRSNGLEVLQTSLVSYESIMLTDRIGDRQSESKALDDGGNKRSDPN